MITFFALFKIFIFSFFLLSAQRIHQCNQITGADGAVDKLVDSPVFFGLSDLAGDFLLGIFIDDKDYFTVRIRLFDCVTELQPLLQRIRPVSGDLPENCVGLAQLAVLLDFLRGCHPLNRKAARLVRLKGLGDCIGENIISHIHNNPAHNFHLLSTKFQILFNLLLLIIKIGKKNALPDWVGMGNFFEILFMMRQGPRYIPDMSDVPDVPGALSKNVEK